MIITLSQKQSLIILVLSSFLFSLILVKFYLRGESSLKQKEWYLRLSADPSRKASCCPWYKDRSDKYPRAPFRHVVSPRKCIRRIHMYYARHSHLAFNEICRHMRVYQRMRAYDAILFINMHLYLLHNNRCCKTHRH